MVISTKSRKLCGVLLILLAGTIAGTLIAVPFSWPMGDFWMDAQQFAGSGHISSSFTPCGYPGLLGLGVRIGGIPAVVAMQVLLYLGIVAAIYWILRLLALDRTTALISASLLGFHPELVINIKKVWDTNITTVFLLLLCAILLAVLRRGLTPTRALLAGIVWGLSINVRPNFPVLILPIAFAFWFAPVRGNRIKALLTSGTLTLAAAALAVIAVSLLVHGSFYVPQNGPYNFYAGDNTFTQRALLDSLNAEPSIYPSLVAEGRSPNVDVYDSGLRPYYVQHALLYVRRNPFQAFKLVLLKLATLLRPDTKIHPLASLGGAVKVLLALAVPLWLTVLMATRHNIWGLEDWLFLVFVVAYVVPFLLTNSDPRFRVPLDLLVLTHAVYRIAKFSPLRFRIVAREGGVKDGFARASR
jgi:4-amino-4-deoxy-L-arabinose transferase-like glycosyltransferase